jgi:hypothetical protein
MVDERRVVYNWRQIGMKLQRTRSGRVRRLSALAAALVLIGAGIFTTYYLTTDTSPAPIPLAFDYSESTRMFALPVNAAATRRIPLSDGSSITLAPGASLEVKANEPRRFLTSLHKGWVRYNVIPDPARIWEVNAELCRVIVLGTQFTVSRTPSAVRIAAHRGTVAVYPPTDDKILATLNAGETYTLRLPKRDSAKRLPKQPRVSDNAQPQPSDNDAEKESRARRIKQRATNANSKSSRLRSSSTKLSGLGGSATVNQLLKRADEARERNQPQKAVFLLERIVREHPQDPAIGLVILTLGKIRLETLHQPRAAALTFKRAAALKRLPSPLREQAYGRCVEAFRRAGDIAAAREISRQYKRRFPTGAWLPLLERWTGSE